jgi:hypothetical protein
MVNITYKLAIMRIFFEFFRNKAPKQLWELQAKAQHSWAGLVKTQKFTQFS